VRRPLTLPLLLAGALAALPVPPAGALTADQALGSSLTRTMRVAGAYSGALVADASTGRVLFAWRPDVLRVPASNQKLYTTAAALLAHGPAARLPTRVLGEATVDDAGTYTGNLYLRGGGDPTFGTLSFNRRAYGMGGTVSGLADRLAAAGIRRVHGAVVGDESLFDVRRGGRTFARLFYIGGPLSALSFNRGLANEYGSAFQLSPATFSAAALTAALRARGISVSGSALQGPTPASARELAAEPSPTIAALAGFVNRPSDNYMAEMLLKGLGAYFAGSGSTAAGVSVARTRLAALGIAPRVYDGSGLSRYNATSPRQVVRLLAAMHQSPALRLAFAYSLPLAGRSGTLAGRMRGTTAAGRCRAKTGTISGASALSGYCTALGGRRLAFSFLMNRTNVVRARALQDAMTATIARDRGAVASP